MVQVSDGLLIFWRRMSVGCVSAVHGIYSARDKHNHNISCVCVRELTTRYALTFTSALVKS